MFGDNKIKLFFCIWTVGVLFSSCGVQHPLRSKKNQIKYYALNSKSLAPYQGINDTTFVQLRSLENRFELDLKYATTDNFLKAQVYDCASCYLRMKTVRNLIEANNELTLLGLHIKIFDCYRPLDVQKKMWQIISNPDYVADPTKGSIHNRGGAVDITLVDDRGRELDMGTSFDYFGPEAAHTYKKHSKKVKANRYMLKEIMLRHNFKAFNSEWWHYNLAESVKDPLANFKWDCP